MKSSEVVLVSAAGVLAGVELNEIGVSSGNRWIDAGIGVGIFMLGHFTNIDGVSDFLEGVGIGYTFKAIV